MHKKSLSTLPRDFSHEPFFYYFLSSSALFSSQDLRSFIKLWEKKQRKQEPRQKNVTADEEISPPTHCIKAAVYISIEAIKKPRDAGIPCLSCPCSSTLFCFAANFATHTNATANPIAT